jgi:uncharacterized delta-60 repeat protein
MNLIESLEPRRMFNFGSLDKTFGDDGFAHDDGNSLTRVNISRVFEQSDGRVITAGNALGNWALRRYLPDGSVDSTFGTDGFAQINVDGNPVGINTVYETPDGGLLVSGFGFVNGANQPNTMLLAKLKPDGSLDTAFPAGGSNVNQPGFFWLDSSFTFQDFEKPVTLLSSGKVFTVSGLDASNVVVRQYNIDGTLDKKFGGSGKLKVDLSFLPTEGVSVAGQPDYTPRQKFAIQSLDEAPDGSVVMTGYYIMARGTVNPDDATPYFDVELPYLVRVSPDGRITDHSFFPLIAKKFNGTNYRGVDLGPTQIQVGSDGKIFLADDQIVMRLNPNFSLDTTFSTDGLATFTAQSSNPQRGTFTPFFGQMDVQADGKLIAVSQSPETADNPLLARMNVDGSTDEVVRLDVDPNITTIPLTLALSRDGTILTGFQNNVARVFRDDAPAGRFEGGTLRDARTGPYKFSVVWRDEDGIDIDSLDNGDVQVRTPGGSNMAAKLISKTLMDDGSVLARYRTGPPDGISWKAIHNGRYTVRLLSNRVSDAAAHFAPARNLGAFNVRIA